MDDRLIALLACPACAGPLGPAQAGLRCPRCQRDYPVRDGVPDLLLRARAESLAHLTNDLPPTAWAYERIWRPRALTLLSGGPFDLARELALIGELAGPPQGGLWVDLGCSIGLYARALAPAVAGAGGLMLAIDLSWPMLREAQRQARGLPIRFARAAAQRLPLAQGAAEAIVIGGSLNEIGDLDACLAAAARALAPGGRLVAMSLTAHPRRAERAVQRAMAPAGIQFWEAGDLCARMARHGLPVERSDQHGIVLFTASVRR